MIVTNLVTSMITIAGNTLLSKYLSLNVQNNPLSKASLSVSSSLEDLSFNSFETGWKYYKKTFTFLINSTKRRGTNFVILKFDSYRFIGQVR